MEAWIRHRGVWPAGKAQPDAWASGNQLRGVRKRLCGAKWRSLECHATQFGTAELFLPVLVEEIAG
jgi:hypothetical protein